MKIPPRFSLLLFHSFACQCNEKRKVQELEGKLVDDVSQEEEDDDDVDAVVVSKHDLGKKCDTGQVGMHPVAYDGGGSSSNASEMPMRRPLISSLERFLREEA